MDIEGLEAALAESGLKRALTRCQTSIWVPGWAALCPIGSTHSDQP